MKSTLCAVALAAVATLALAGCVTGVDPETRAALRETLESVQELTDLWEERLNDLDEAGAGPPTEPPAEPPTVPETVTGSGSGSVTTTGTATLTDYYDLGTGTTKSGWDLSSWGVKATGKDGTHLFTADLNGSGVLRSYSADPFFSLILGFSSLDNPVGYGTATWRGKVRAYETEDATFGTPVEGDARLQMDLDSILDTIDVDFTNFERGHANMGWNNVSVSLGRFRSFLYGDLEGKFYGDEHEGVAGTFERDDLKGVFGGVRQ